MVPRRTSVSLIVSALNEEENLQVLIEKSLQVLPRHFDRFEIIVIDDGSKDRTAEVVSQWTAKSSNVKLLRHPVNLGVGASIRDGLRAMTCDWAFQIPGDNQFDIAEVEKFVPELSDADVVQGWRVNLSYTLRRRIVTKIYRTLLRALFGLNLKDPTWVKMIRRELAQSLPVITDGFFGEIEIIIRARRKGARFAEVGVHTQQRMYGNSTATSLTRVFRTFVELVRFRIQLMSDAEEAPPISRPAHG